MTGLFTLFTSKTFLCVFSVQLGEVVLVGGGLFAPVLVDDCTWTVDRSAAAVEEGGVAVAAIVEFSLAKLDPKGEKKWPYIIETDGGGGGGGAAKNEDDEEVHGSNGIAAATVSADLTDMVKGMFGGDVEVNLGGSLSSAASSNASGVR